MLYNTYDNTDGTASAHVSTLGGRYDYEFDGHDRLIAAEYSNDDNLDEDFSTSYFHYRKGIMTPIQNDPSHSSKLEPNGALRDIKNIIKHPNDNSQKIIIEIQNNINFDLSKIKLSKLPK